MGQMKTFPAATAKIRALSAALLTNADFVQLLDMKSPVEITRYLLSKPYYKEFLADLDTIFVSRLTIENRLQKYRMHQLTRLSHYYPPAYQSWIDTYLLQFEVQDIQLLLRTFVTDLDAVEMKENLLVLPFSSHVDLDVLIKQRTLRDFIDVLKGTIYEEPLRSLEEEDVLLRQFHMEMQLDKLYFSKMHGAMNKLAQEDRSVMTKLFGQHVDLMNIQWLYRARRYYKLGREEILNYSIPYGKALSFEQMKRLLYSDSFEEELIAFTKRHYGDLFQVRETELWRSFETRFLREVLHVNRQHPMSLVEFLNYSNRLHVEVLNLTSLVEGSKYESDVTPFLLTLTKLPPRGGV